MKQILDGCTAATYITYALSDVATIYPITPVASMGETAQKWGMAGRKNYAGNILQVKEMESELGAAGATHGALAAGSLATTFTNSQGLMLMLPNMFKIAGNHLPAVFHVGARSIATHALSIFGDHSDVMATRASGFTYLASDSVQEAMDLALVAHLAAVEGSLPVCHFFDGWRTSNQMETVELIPYDTVFSLIDRDKIKAFRAHALNPDHPTLAGSAQNDDVYFQNSEASNSSYAAFPDIVQGVMDRVAKATGRSYHLFDYVGPADADTVLVSIGSSSEVIEQTLPSLASLGYKVGVVKVRLFRPFSAQALMAAVPESVRTIVALDRTKEPGAEGEPLFKDVATAVLMSGRSGISVHGCRYGLSSKDFTPAMVKAIADEVRSASPRRFFTVGITDDVTHLSLDVDYSFIVEPMTGAEGKECMQAVFYGMGSDGTVGATKQAARIISDVGNLYAQAYFSYSAKKSGGYTVSELRFAPTPVKAAYSITDADYVACCKDVYVKRFRLARNLRQGGTFVLNCSWTSQQLDVELPASLRHELADKKAQLYTIDAQAIAAEVGLGVRVNMIMETVFFHLTHAVAPDKAMAALRDEITRAYLHEGGEVVQKNLKAIDMAVAALRQVDIPDSWAGATETVVSAAQLPGGIPKDTRTFFKVISEPCLKLEGNELPVSVFSPDGHMPMGTTAYEKRRIALNVPEWNPEKCVQCTECSFVCPHAAIRPYLLTADEIAKAPAEIAPKLLTVKWIGNRLVDGGKGAYSYRIQNYTEDCTGCGSCATVCPGRALTMKPIATQLSEQLPLLKFIQENVTVKSDLIPRFTVDGSQLQQPLLQFSGACAGCGETPYIKLLTQLFGERMLMANATGCSSVWGANYPSNAYCVRDSDGRGPAWGNSLFEDNAEYGYGMAVAVRQRREALAATAQAIIDIKDAPSAVVSAASAWLEAYQKPDESFSTGKVLVEVLKNYDCEADSPEAKLRDTIIDGADMLGKKSVWAVGGDGWAYDIGFAGLDHVLASGEDINLLVMDTECYSNTGGQTSKATPLGAVTKYSPDGKRTFKKDLGRMMMTYGTVYVASVAIGANMQQVIDAMREAEAYPGPSIIIAYCPCINHGIRAGMGHSIVEERLAVQAGYWPIYRYNPMLAAQQLSPYIQDEATVPGRTATPIASQSPSKAETADDSAAGEGQWMRVNDENRLLTVDFPLSTLQKPEAKASAVAAPLFPLERLNAFLDGEDRYADITMVAPQTAPRLRRALSQRTNLLHTLLDGLSDIL